MEEYNAFLQEMLETVKKLYEICVYARVMVNLEIGRIASRVDTKQIK